MEKGKATLQYVESNIPLGVMTGEKRKYIRCQMGASIIAFILTDVDGSNHERDN